MIIAAHCATVLAHLYCATTVVQCQDPWIDAGSSPFRPAVTALVAAACESYSYGVPRMSSRRGERDAGNAERPSDRSVARGDRRPAHHELQSRQALARRIRAPP